ncbi:MAG: flagellar hook-associated protein FlgK [Acidimicrobiales bacterium]|nr:flagellar hook-associated protein FlgK [Acidimicrobiales bacterium]
MIDGLMIGVNGLLAAQRSLDVVAHNLANVNTPDYARQRVVLKEAPPVTGFRPGQGAPAYGMGVVIQGIELMTDRFVEASIREQKSHMGSLTATADLATRIDEVLGRTDGGLGDSVSRFWGAWDQLALTPELMATRNGVLEAGQDLAGALREAKNMIDDVVAEADFRLRDQVDEINTLAEQVARLNGEIMSVHGRQGVAGDLITERYRLVNRLSELAGASLQVNDDGSADVLIPGGMLVGGSKASQIEVTTGPPAEIVWSDTGLPSATRGSTGAIRDALDGGFDDLYERYDLLANGIRTAVNALHAAGTDLDGTTGVDFFTGTGAGDLEVNAALTARGVAASASGPSADGNQAVAIGSLRVQAIIADPSDPTTPVATASASISNLVAEIGRRAQSAERRVESATAIGADLEVRRGEISGVSVDEELTDMLRFQRAYEASARVLTSMDQMLDTLINRVGVVGR